MRLHYLVKLKIRVFVKILIKYTKLNQFLLSVAPHLFQG